MIIKDIKVLIIDDSDIDRMVMRDFCSSEGLKIIDEAKDGEEGLEKILQNKPDLVFIDMYMPKIDGIDICRELHKQNLHKDTLIIMQAGVDNPKIKAEAFELGIADFITKPLHKSEVMSRTLAHLERRLIKNSMEKEFTRVQSELKEAMILQSILLPNEDVLNEIKESQGLDIAHYYHPSSELGGDYLAVHKLSETKTLLIIADVSGHGITAAMYTFVIHTLLDDKFLYNSSPGKILEELNNKLHKLLVNGKFATMFLAIIDVETSTIEYSAAASPQPVLFSAKEVILLDTEGFLLGTQNNAEYKTQTHPFNKGDVICLYSDALIETPNKQMEYFTENNLIDLLSEKSLSNASSLLKEIISKILGEYSTTPADDLSIMVCKREF